jgi:glycosyltransferase involved in cell wall biosynthesis
MKQALERLASTDLQNITLLIVGAHLDHWDATLPFEVRAIDHLDDDAMLAQAYSAADVFVLPTLADNLPNGLLESMACGTVPITFDVGGCGEAVHHLETGYLAKYQDVADLAAGLHLLLRDDELRSRLAQKGRALVEAEYSQDLQTRRFIELYDEVIERHQDHAASISSSSAA